MFDVVVKCFKQRACTCSGLNGGPQKGKFVSQCPAPVCYSLSYRPGGETLLAFLNGP